MSKCLIIGDTHFDTKCEGYLDVQVESTLKLVKEHKPKYIVFLGDIYHHRKPTPEVVVAVHKLFQKISLTPGVTKIYVLRGNHDSQNRSDDGLTALETLCYPGSKVTVVKHTIYDPSLNFLLIPHYEDDDVIKEHLDSKGNEKTVAFGHFSYTPDHLGIKGFESSLKLTDFKCRTILGHIHKHLEDEHVTILGTPWTTNFGESDKDNFVGVMEEIPGGWGPLNKFKVRFGPRFYEAPYEALEAMEYEISDKNYFTLLRVILNRFSDDPISILRADIANKFKVAYVDIKFQPIYDDKLNERLSGYDPNIPLTVIDDDIITRYVEEQASTIPQEMLERGLNLIREYADQDTDS